MRPRPAPSSSRGTPPARPTVLVVNAGSSSIKLSVFALADVTPELPAATEPAPALAYGCIEGIGFAPRLLIRAAGGRVLVDESFPVAQVADHDAAFRLLKLALTLGLHEAPPLAIGHRVVHGGTRFAGPVAVDDTVLETLQTLVPLAPLHQPHNLAAIRAARTIAPSALQVACFDTAFHRGHAPDVDLFALPYALYEKGVRRYGFHGLSYEYIAQRLKREAPDIADGRVIVAHLGGGASLCALRDGRSVDTTMGLTALDGLPMVSRCGALDPGAVLYLQQQEGMSTARVQTLLYHESGLKGISGLTGDMRELLASRAPRAALAVQHLVYRIVQEIGRLAAVLGGVDALVFTAGIGANSAEIRARVCERAAGLLQIEVDPEANAAHGPCVSSVDSAVQVFALATDEERMIARHTAAILTRTRKLS